MAKITIGKMLGFVQDNQPKTILEVGIDRISEIQGHKDDNDSFVFNTHRGHRTYCGYEVIEVSGNKIQMITTLGDESIAQMVDFDDWQAFIASRWKTDH